MNDISIYEYAKSRGTDLNNQKKSNLKIGDRVILKHETANGLYDSFQIDSEKYKEIHINNIQGVILNIETVNDHYRWGEYVRIRWDNNTESESAHVSWIESIKNYD